MRCNGIVFFAVAPISSLSRRSTTIGAAARAQSAPKAPAVSEKARSRDADPAGFFRFAAPAVVHVHTLPRGKTSVRRKQGTHRVAASTASPPQSKPNEYRRNVSATATPSSNSSGGTAVEKTPLRSQGRYLTPAAVNLPVSQDGACVAGNVSATKSQKNGAAPLKLANMRIIRLC
ncbi:hypothetical protein DQ04_00081050 [Trypanosoma grayi]|uniref:hypothetical protein n=1 Tax=Trypanosoma grayi TaxID=71804 RepID=UPI0004F43B3D|nr:hypothetical protein DQ04_00081050 [Trypanosoma grayi]KEG15406.1 hypothetical protein DQ04_00081050 [Trypanosoma grayi]